MPHLSNKHGQTGKKSFLLSWHFTSIREKDKAKKEVLASPSLVSHMHILLKNAIYLDAIGLLWNLIYMFYILMYLKVNIILQDTGASCPKQLWVYQPWNCSRPGWMVLWATWSSGKRPCPWQGCWNWMVFKSPFQLRLFYDSKKLMIFHIEITKLREGKSKWRAKV